MPYEAVITRLKGETAVSSLVGERVYPRMAPESVRPGHEETKYSSYVVVTRPNGIALNASLGRVSGTKQIPLKLYCCAKTHQLACQIADAVIAVLAPFDSDYWNESQTWGEVTVSHCSLIDSYDGSTDPQFGDEVGIPIEVLEMTIDIDC